MKMPTAKQRTFSRGFGLIELMVALTIGLVLILAISYFFLGSRQSSRVHDDSSRMQENARNALDIMGRAIRQAGYRSNYAFPISFVVMEGINDANVANPDSITVRYEGQQGGERDCTGAAKLEGDVMVFAFVVNAARELTCGGTVIAENVENMKITYGIDTARSGVISSYVSAPTDFGQVAVVNIVLTMRGANANAATGGDGYLRQTYSASYTVRNQAG